VPFPDTILGKMNEIRVESYYRFLPGIILTSPEFGSRAGFLFTPEKSGDFM